METAKNRDPDILRTAVALAPMVRAKYLSDKIKPDTPFRWEVLVRAITSGMSPRAFEQLFVLMTHANPDGTNAFPTHETIAAIIGDSPRTSERATEELETLGWISSEQTRRGPAIRKIMIGREKPPRPKGQAIAGESLEPSKMAVLDDDSSKFLNHQICQPRTAKNGGLPTTVTYEGADHQARDGSYLRGEGEKAERQLGVGTQPQAATYRSTRRRRGEMHPW